MDKGVGGLENWAIFKDVICVSSLNSKRRIRHLFGTTEPLN